MNRKVYTGKSIAKSKLAKLSTEQLDDRIVPDGLAATYFANANLTGSPAISRVDPTVNFNYGNGGPTGLPVNQFSVRWQGEVLPPVSGVYRFETNSDDGVRLWVNNQLVIDQWNDHPATGHSGLVSLTANQRVPIRLEYYENSGQAVIQLSWTPPNQLKSIIPSTALFSSSTISPPPPPPAGSSKYQLSNGLKTWSQAQTEANSLGGYLVVINSAQEEANLKQLFGTAEEFWIGLTDTSNEGKFVWLNNDPVNYTNFATGEPNNFGGDEDYVSMNYGSGGKWNDWGSTQKFLGIIEIPNGTSPPPPPPPYNGGSTYELTSRQMTWAEAQAEAVSRGGNLVAISSIEEELAIKQQVGEGNPYWIGLSDNKTEGNYEWVSGETLSYTNWLPGEPNNFGGNEDYIIMNYGSSSQWNDADAKSLYRGVIEFPPAPGQIGLESSVVSGNENGKSVAVKIQRRNGSAGTITVDYRTTPGTATAGSDYTAVIGSVTFGPGETVKTVNIPLLNDALIEGSENFGFTIDNVQGGASLLAPRTATITIVDDDSPLPDLFYYPTINDPGVFDFNGPATIANNSILLTNATNQVSSAFLRRPLTVDANTSFSSRFTFRLSGGTNNGEGITFALQNSTSLSGALGLGGLNLGYGGIPSSLAVKFDTVQQSGELSNNFISLLTNGNMSSPVQSVAAPFDLNSGSDVFAWVDYDGATNTLRVFLSSTNVKPGSATLTQANIDLPALVGNRAFMGFTGSTSAAFNTQEVSSWAVASNNQLLPDPNSFNVSKEDLYAGLIQPTALDFSTDGRNTYIAEQRGIIRVARDGVLQTSPFLDFRDRINGTRDRGLLDIAVHPNFPSQPYIYLLYTYDPPEVYSNPNDPLAGPDKNGNRAGRLTRVTADAATNYTTIVPNSEYVLVGRNSTWNNFNAFVNSTTNFSEPAAGIRSDGSSVDDFIATDSESHTVGAIEFGPDGNLYATIGDGVSYNQVDPRASRVQDVNNLSGKVLRIDPITGAGLSDNPFWNGNPNSNRSKVYQLGVRNAFRMGIDQVTGKVYLGDVGWYTWEEVNTGGPGANFGWPYFEGGVGGTNSQTPGYKDLASAQAFYTANTPVTAPLIGLNHNTDGINAIVLGDVYRGNAYPDEFRGNLFFNDLGQGVVRRAKLNPDGSVASVQTFTTGANVVVQMKQGKDGFLYYVDLDNGTVGRWIVT